MRAVLHGAGDLSAHGAADRVVSHAAAASCCATPWRSGRAGWPASGPGELSLTATRGLRSLHTYYARYLPQAAAAAVIPVILLVWVATQDWLSFVVVIALVARRARHHDLLRPGGDQALGAPVAPARLAGRPVPPARRRASPPCAPSDARHHGRREVEAATEGVRAATMRTLRVAFLSALSMDMIAGFGVGFVAMVLGLRLLWGELGLQTAMAVLLVAPEIFIPLRRAGAEFHASTEGQAAAARVLEVLATPVPAGTAAGADGADGRPPRRGRGRPPAPALAIDGLRVDYEHRDHPALDVVLPPRCRRGRGWR